MPPEKQRSSNLEPLNQAFGLNSAPLNEAPPMNSVPSKVAPCSKREPEYETGEWKRALPDNQPPSNCALQNHDWAQNCVEADLTGQPARTAVPGAPKCSALSRKRAQ